MKKSKQPLIWVGIIVIILILLSWNRIFPAKTPVAVAPGNLPGIQANAGPWDTATPSLLARLKAIDLPALASEGTVLHIHQHVDLYINGAKVQIPAEIGVNQAANFISPLHTHDTSGIVHVESNVVRDFTLGQFFDVWGVRFSQDCIGGYCADATNTLKVYANGVLVSGDPSAMVLKSHEEIMIVYGTTTPAIIPSYVFPSGY
ncbi:MAG: hypothetical protein JWL88_320 [Parcubacteria group bacterium]|nr:hypothetical protein [Parcubacteria group bacterium]